MGNRTIGKYFISILGVSLLLFGVASAGSFAADQWLFGKRFGDHTYAGPFDLSNQTSREAEIKLTSDLLGMQDNLQADLVYQDTEIPLPADLVEYNPSATVDQAETEAENPLLATVSEDGLRALLKQELPMLTLSDGEITALAQGISDKLASGIMPQSVHLADYLESSQPTSAIASAELAVDGFSVPMMDIVEALDGHVLEPKQPFSLLAFTEETEPGLVADDELTLVASALYEAALKTNFWVEDRSIRTELLDGVKPGFEAAVNRQLGLDLKVTNPNDTSYMIRSKWSDGALHVSIVGLPLRFAYEPYVAETNTFKPKTTIQYNRDFAVGRVDELEKGKDGLEVIVQRKVVEDGEVLNIEAVSEDFYAPVARVEEHALARPEQETGTGDGSAGSDGTGTDGQPSTDGTANDGTGSTSDGSTNGNTDGGNSSGGNESQNGNTSNKPPSGGTGSGNGGNNASGSKPPSGNPDDAVGNLNGKPSTKPESDGHIYDKGGNLIK
ncbi:hypothetical protein NCCP2716_12910 [Sporosarcina sp. NCCP-2716]|uniref:VanW family protein n=1 Tax=Sporosarcina sp. NCCP-2716 TaxID=2943679 RepID=UPI00203D30D8|nr:VanW family protein [Sporosarcina sp. NCCP-2716]GKV68793.1 hypothetical protein NCCP2716_12910 [Sporosarcina sp. NCCP-2716]